MNFRMTPQIGLSSICGTLLLIYLCEGWAPLPQISVPPRGLIRPSLRVTATADFVPPSARTFDAINDRPIFAPDRKPLAPPPVGTSSAPPPLPSISLVGVILDSNTQLALIRSAASPLEVSYAVGASVDGWQLTEIDAEKIVLRYGSSVDEIELKATSALPDERAQQRPPSGTVPVSTSAAPQPGNSSPPSSPAPAGSHE